MSGHNKWAKIKHKKASADAAKGRVYTRLIKEITIAARMGGGDESGNARLRKAIQDAKAANMPWSNIERAIKKGTGELEGVHYEEVTYEGYGPGGVAIMVELITDNKNRAVSEIRHIFSKHGGNLAASGAVSWKFDKKGIIAVAPLGRSEDDILMLALEAGAEDVKYDPESTEILTAPGDLEAVKSALEKQGLKIEKAEVGMYPKDTVKVDGKEAEQLLRLMDAIEEHDDIQKVYSNYDIDVEVMAQLSEA
ncbi:MAG: YebC/PmpR family DNA-binding transcriptional regulator [candidate division KSB1 bacterium]|nr:YebC/PmpR family DNA-binding transcriptional regulator [candidate division KSB1 bacterium]MDZ7303088.1 YebC/PmpR family DNA-binding transcriptional regulator [candidate division KSB1 bacterium]MDZ7312627.1 YebC/PmpR family DNA-binding transcriptional regulator [candidate division KSB1 bacterium]